MRSAKREVWGSASVYELRIIGEDGRDLPAGEIGEIIGRGPITMPGYYGRPDLTAEALRDGWLYTGDVGHVDEDGFLYLVDRIKDMIDSGGIKVYPKDVEEIAARHPAVREVAVFGFRTTNGERLRWRLLCCARTRPPARKN
jgi:acyl-CoA synthetase (AMP-forming)/AMP-acid ligase II